jgi:ABC-type protease/lipase transport system fused ATPase/permease subunit
MKCIRTRLSIALAPGTSISTIAARAAGASQLVRAIVKEVNPREGLEQ